MDGDVCFENFLLNILQNQFEVTSANITLTDPVYKGVPNLLHAAVKRGDIRLTELLINEGCDVNATDDDGNTPLMIVPINEYYVICTLLRTNAKVLLTNKYGKCAADKFIRDVRITDCDLLELLLKKIKEECSNDSLLTAKTLLQFDCELLQAVILKDMTVTKYLIDNGCDVNEDFKTALYQHTSYTALHMAVANSDIKSVKLLIHYGADVDANNVRNEKPLHLLKAYKDESAEILKLLVDSGASLFDSEGNFIYDCFLVNGNQKFINTLINLCKLDFNHKNTEGWSLLLFIASNRTFDPIEEIQSQHIDQNTINNVYMDEIGITSALRQAVMFGNVRTVEFLLMNGAEVNFVYNDEVTALTEAFYPIEKREPEQYLDIRWNLKCIELLLQYGADAQWKNSRDNTIFDKGLKSFVLIKPILAHLALIQAQGLKLEDFILTKINSCNSFKKYFDCCKKKVEEMKSNVLSRSVTLFEFITIKEEKITKFACNKILVSKLQLIVYSTRRSKLYYHKILRKRAAKLIPFANLRIKASSVFSRVEGLENNCIIIKKIVDFLNYDDLLIIANV